MLQVAIAAFVLAAIRGELPPDRTSALHAKAFPWAVETAEQRDERYVFVAADIAAAAFLEPAEHRARLAALLTAVALRESALAPDVDLLECHPLRVKNVKGANCDGGKAASIFQLWGFRAPTRAAYALEARAQIGKSRRACQKLPPEERLAVYARGNCESARGRELSRDREAYAARILQRYLRTDVRDGSKKTARVVKGSEAVMLGSVDLPRGWARPGKSLGRVEYATSTILLTD
jgi:hypothetical protein